MVLIICVAALKAQQPATPQAAPETKPPVADLNQVMRALFFPLSNVVFFSQIHDPEQVKPNRDSLNFERPSHRRLRQMASRGEQRVGRSAMQRIFLLTPGRKCSNGAADMPFSNPDWVKLANATSKTQE